MKYSHLFKPMNILSSFKELEGRTVVFAGNSDSHHEGGTIAIVTDDHSVLMAFASEENDELVVSILAGSIVHDSIISSHEFRNTFSYLGYFDHDKYQELITSEMEQRAISNAEQTLERERAEYERLKAKFETNGAV